MEEVLDDMDPIEAEVHAIRQQMWEETKHMTMEERWAYMRKLGEQDYKKFKLKFVTLPPVKRHWRSEEQPQQ